MASSTQNGDRLPTDGQVALAAWFAEYKGIELPPDVHLSGRAWWGWINSQISRIDREDAREVHIDFHLRIEPSDPVSIIGALKYREKVQTTNIVDRAVEKILKNVHPYDVQDELGLSQDQIDEAARIAEVKHHFEIDWGSV